MSTHIESKKEDVAPVVLMPGDPKRCEYIAKKYLSNCRLINDVRGMTAYTGYYKSHKITLFPSGMGIPSMGIYSYELLKEYDVKYIIRIGTMGSYTNLKLKDIVLVDNSITNSNYGMYAAGYNSNIIKSNDELNNIIMNSASINNIPVYRGNIYSSDVFYEKDNNYKEIASKYNVLGVEMESYALFVNASIFNKKASTLLMVSDSFLNTDKLSQEERERGLDNLIVLALESCLKLG